MIRLPLHSGWCIEKDYACLKQRKSNVCRIPQGFARALVGTRSEVPEPEAEDAFERPPMFGGRVYSGKSGVRAKPP